MKKIGKSIVLTVILIFLSSGIALAGDAEMEQLKQQIQQLTQRITELEQDKKTLETSGEPDVMFPAEAETSQAVPEQLLRTRVQQAIRKEMRARMEAEGEAQKINQYVTMFGLVEVEVVFGEDFENDSFSEFNVATVELGFDAQVSEWATGHIRALYEGGEDDDDLDIDAATIWLGNYEKFPVLMTAGKFYMPFGNFETNMVQDSMTLEIGEINAMGMGVGFERSGFYGSVYSYKGMNEIDSSDHIGGFGAMLNYGYQQDKISIDGGVSYVSNIADSGGISDVLDENGLEEIEDRVAGIGAHLVAGYGPFFFIGEYIQVMDAFEVSEISFDNDGAEPKAWNTELAYATELLGRTTVFAIGYQGTSEAVNLGLPESRFLGSASMIIFNGTALTLEYFYDNDYDEKDGGTGESGYAFTTQLAYEF